MVAEVQAGRAEEVTAVEEAVETPTAPAGRAVAGTAVETVTQGPTVTESEAAPLEAEEAQTVMQERRVGPEEAAEARVREDGQPEEVGVVGLQGNTIRRGWRTELTSRTTNRKRDVFEFPVYIGEVMDM